MTIQHLRGGVALIGTAAELVTANPVLLQRQLSLETDTGVQKIGDGTTHYASLSAVPGGGGGGGSGSKLRAHYLASGVTIDGGLTVPTGTWFNPPWIPYPLPGGTGTHDGDILDLTDPANPAMKMAGWVELAIEFMFTASTREVGKSAYVEIDLDLNGEDANLATQISLAPDQNPFGTPSDVQAALSMRWHVPQGGVLSVAVQHDLTADANPCIFNAYVIVEPD